MPRSLRSLLIILTLVHGVAFAVIAALEFAQAEGMVLADGMTPLGGDFFNQWTAARMTLEGNLDDVYDPARFMAFQKGQVGTFTGLRFWAYPPHSLLFTWPFGLGPYALMLLGWSALGLAVLAWGARSAGLSGGLILFLLLSPAAVHCVFLGQSGNLASGLLLLALSDGRSRRWLTIAATSALTVKPQLGFMLPVLWAVRGRWRLIALVSFFTTALLLLSLLISGSGAWADYVGRTLPQLSHMHREGSGPFTYLMPSFFLAARLLSGDGDLALLLHIPFALAVFGYLLFRLRTASAPKHERALILIGTALITPYLYIYDLPVVLAGVLLALPRPARWTDSPPDRWLVAGVIAAWSLPYITVIGNATWIPLSPALMLAILILTDRTFSTRGGLLSGGQSESRVLADPSPGPSE